MDFWFCFQQIIVNQRVINTISHATVNFASLSTPAPFGFIWINGERTSLSLLSILIPFFVVCRVSHCHSMHALLPSSNQEKNVGSRRRRQKRTEAIKFLHHCPLWWASSRKKSGSALSPSVDLLPLPFFCLKWNLLSVIKSKGPDWTWWLCALREVFITGARWSGSKDYFGIWTFSISAVSWSLVGRRGTIYSPMKGVNGTWPDTRPQPSEISASNVILRPLFIWFTKESKLGGRIENRLFRNCWNRIRQIILERADDGDGWCFTGG